MKTLYLGLDPKNYICPGTLIHYPVIRTVRIEGSEGKKALLYWSRSTIVIFTSQTAVNYWKMGLTGKRLIAIGSSTADAIRKKGGHPLIAPAATQEGVIALLESLDLQKEFLFIPRSRLARSALTEYLKGKGIQFFALDLYDTLYQKLEPVPDLNDIDEIVFTSPSTVEGFLRIYKELPRDKTLIPIGPITAKEIECRLNN